MHRIGIVGVSSRRHGMQSLERFTIPQDDRAHRLPELAREIGAVEMLYLATCNRVEIAFRGDEVTPRGEYRLRVFRALTGREPRPGEAERTFQAWAGEGAVEHLFLVSAGLDSAQVGEREIRGQLRNAQLLARAVGLCRSLLDRIVTEALRTAKRIHRRIEGRGGRVSLADIAMDHLLERLERTPGAVAVVGLSPMTRRCAQLLARERVPLFTVNRTPERAAEMAREFGSEWRSLDEFRQRPDPVEAILLATGSHEPVLARPDLERIAARCPSGEAPLIVDMAIPPDVSPKDAEAAGVQRLGMDRITMEAEASRARRLVELAPAREAVDEALAGLRHRLAERSMSPVVASINRRYRQTAVEGVERLLAGQLKNLGEPEREAILRWAEVMARRFAHIPTMGLKSLASEVGVQAVRAFLEGSGEDLFGDSVDLADRLEELSALAEEAEP